MYYQLRSRSCESYVCCPAMDDDKHVRVRQELVSVEPFLKQVSDVLAVQQGVYYFVRQKQRALVLSSEGFAALIN